MRSQDNFLGLSCFSNWHFYLPIANKKKTDLTKLIDEWNRMEGIPKGIYFALGTENGVSSDDFFMSLVPLRYIIIIVIIQHQK